MGDRVAIRVESASRRGRTDARAFHILPVIWRLILVQLIVSLIIGVVVLVVLVLIFVPVAAVWFQSCRITCRDRCRFLDRDTAGILPGRLRLGRFSIAMALVVDRQLGVTESLSESLYYTRGNVIAIFGACRRQLAFDTFCPRHVYARIRPGLPAIMIAMARLSAGHRPALGLSTAKGARSPPHPIKLARNADSATNRRTDSAAGGGFRRRSAWNQPLPAAPMTPSSGLLAVAYRRFGNPPGRYGQAPRLDRPAASHRAMINGSGACAMAVFSSTPSTPNSMATATSLAVPTPASTITG